MTPKYEDLLEELTAIAMELEAAHEAWKGTREERWALQEYLEYTGQTEDYQQHKEAMELL